MKILDIKVTRGPNYWSVKKHRLVVMQLDIEGLETEPTDEINGFYRNIKKVFPGLYDHYCSEGVPGGFFERVKRGTWMGHVVEHIAIELQILAGLDAKFGRTRGTGTTGVYHVVFECFDEQSGRLCAEKAVSIAGQLIEGTDIDTDRHVMELREVNLRNMPGPSTTSILREAEARNIPYIKLEDSTYQLGYGCHQKRFMATITSSTSTMAAELASEKDVCRNMFNEMCIPIAEGGVVNSADELKEFVNSIGFPLVAKPVRGNQGRGVTTNINSINEALKAFKTASEISNGVILERHIPGNDYRLLTVNYKFAAAAKRTTAHVLGDGESTIQQLINKINMDSCRGEGHDKVLTKIKVCPTTFDILFNKGYTLNTVLPEGEILYLDHAANLSKGGTAEDVTDTVHDDIKLMAERISRIIDLDICGIDVIAPDLEQPLHESGGVVLEVNAAPGFRMHLSPSSGNSRNVAAPVLDMLFPEGEKSRIPITAVTGTNGKTTTTRLISHILKNSGSNVGYTTTDGIYLNDQLLMKGDCGGPQSAEMLLKDPVVEAAVFECARGGILRAGLGFDQCDVAVVTNIDSDHLGLNGIQNLDQMSRLKSVVPESVHPGGYAVLNADDKRVLAMRNKLRCNIVLFSMDAENPEIVSHREAGGICVVLEDDQITLLDKKEIHRINNPGKLPLTFDGRARFMIENILAAVAAAYVQNVSPAVIRKSLNLFEPTPEQLPGRMNLFKFDDFDVLIDYCHNPAGMAAVKEFIDTSSYRNTIGIVCGIGDRRDEDNFEIGRLSAELFDKIIIREDDDLRGREPGENTEIVRQGIASSPHNPQVVAIPKAKEAIYFAMENVLPDSMIVLFAENVSEALDIMKKEQTCKNNCRPNVLKMQNGIALPQMKQGNYQGD